MEFGSSVESGCRSSCHMVAKPSCRLLWSMGFLWPAPLAQTAFRALPPVAADPCVAPSGALAYRWHPLAAGLSYGIAAGSEARLDTRRSPRACLPDSLGHPIALGGPPCSLGLGRLGSMTPSRTANRDVERMDGRWLPTPDAAAPRVAAAPLNLVGAPRCDAGSAGVAVNLLVGSRRAGSCFFSSPSARVCSRDAERVEAWSDSRLAAVPKPYALAELFKGCRPISPLVSPGKLYELFRWEHFPCTVAPIDICLLGFVPGKQPLEIAGAMPAGLAGPTVGSCHWRLFLSTSTELATTRSRVRSQSPMQLARMAEALHSHGVPAAQVLAGLRELHGVRVSPALAGRQGPAVRLEGGNFCDRDLGRVATERGFGGMI